MTAKCEHCGRAPIKDGYQEYDACIGKIPIGLMNACCGHGETTMAYIQFLDGNCIRGLEALTAMEAIKTGYRNEIIGHLADDIFISLMNACNALGLIEQQLTEEGITIISRTQQGKTVYLGESVLRFKEIGNGFITNDELCKMRTQVEREQELSTGGGCSHSTTTADGICPICDPSFSLRP